MKPKQNRISKQKYHKVLRGKFGSNEIRKSSHKS